MRLAPVLEVPAGLDRLEALYHYDGPVRGVVAGLKYRGDLGALGWLARGLAAHLVRWQPDLVTWAPTTPARAARRGGDQAELLARAAARQAGLPVARLLRRRPGPSQTGRHRVLRLADGPRFEPRWSIEGLYVAVIDDVTTTGATIRGAAEALLQAGAGRVAGLCLAATPN